MTIDQIGYYLSVCEREYPYAAAMCREIYRQPGYSVSWTLAAAEIGYWYEHRCIEPYFMCIQQVIETDDGLIFVHKEPARLQ